MDAPSRYRFGARGHGAGIGTLMVVRKSGELTTTVTMFKHVEHSGFLHGMIINTDISKFNHWYDLYFYV
jgi:hypothetical protein